LANFYPTIFTLWHFVFLLALTFKHNIDGKHDCAQMDILCIKMSMKGKIYR